MTSQVTPTTTTQLANGASKSTIGPRRRPLSAHDYEQMGRLGLFEGLRVELIDGEIVEMPPIGEDHARNVTKATTRLTVALHERLLIRCKTPSTQELLDGPNQMLCLHHSSL